MHHTSYTYFPLLVIWNSVKCSEKILTNHVLLCSWTWVHNLSEFCHHMRMRPRQISFLHIQPSSLWRNVGSQAGREPGRTQCSPTTSSLEPDYRAPTECTHPRTWLELTLKLKHSGYIQGWWSDSTLQMFPKLPGITLNPEDRNANLCALYMYFEFPVSLYSNRNT